MVKVAPGPKKVGISAFKVQSLRFYNMKRQRFEKNYQLGNGMLHLASKEINVPGFKEICLLCFEKYYMFASAIVMLHTC